MAERHAQKVIARMAGRKGMFFTEQDEEQPEARSSRSDILSFILAAFSLVLPAALIVCAVFFLILLALKFW